MFSCISKHLNKFNAWTVKSLISSVKDSYTTITPNVVELEHVLDMQDFYEEHLPTACSLNNISTPHQFVIKVDKEATGPVKSCITCRMWSNTEETPPCHLLQSLPEQKPLTKAGRHMFYSADGDQDFDKLYSQFEKEFESVSKRFQFPEEVVMEWEGTFSRLQNLMALESD